MKKRMKKILISILSFGVIIFLFSSCGEKGMVVAVTTLPDSLNPIIEQNTSGLNINELLFDGLTNFEINPVSNTLFTDFALAENIEQNQDRKTYTVTLRDLHWHDETPVTAEDVVFSFEAYTFEGNNSPQREYLTSFIKEIREINSKTVEIEFRNPLPEFRAYPVLTFKIIPSHYNGAKLNVDLRNGTNERKFATNPIGTGPFKLKDWDIGKSLLFTANGLYYKTIPKADTLEIKRMIDPIVRMNELKKGGINIILETNPMDRPIIREIGNVDINSYMPNAFYQVEINTQIFKKAEARQAMAMALDKKNLIPGITDSEDLTIINNGPFPSNIFALNASDYIDEPMPNHLPYDLSKAKLLAEKGNISGQNAILIYPDSMGDFGKAMSEKIASELAKIGLNVEVKRTGNQVFQKTVYKDKSFELALVYHDGFDNIYSTIGDLYKSKSPLNVSGISDTRLNTLIADYEKEIVTSKWINLVLQIDERLTTLSPALYLCSIQKDVYSRGVGNVLIASDNPFLSVEQWTFKRDTKKKKG